MFVVYNIISFDVHPLQRERRDRITKKMRPHNTASDKVGAPISIGFARADFEPVRQRASIKPIEIGAPTATLSMALPTPTRRGKQR
jgi:hypothetical protein